MNDRYLKLAEIGVKDLKGYNKVAEERMAKPDGKQISKLPQILIIIDDLYDLLSENFTEIQTYIVRLAQVARAVGIYLVISTQRPSTDVITGLIKANFPSRIAFKVFSAVDSRVILDESGAEKLLGNGDMLFKPQGYLKPIRIQGAYVSLPEISDVVDYFRNQILNNRYDDKILGKLNDIYTKTNDGIKTDERDPYFIEAGKFVIEKEKASIGMIQRVFKIGFNRAVRIIDQLEEAGIVGAEEGTKPRKILMTMGEFEDKIYEMGQLETNESKSIQL